MTASSRGSIHRRAVATFLTIALSLGAANVATAAPSAADRETARTLMTEGRALRAKGDHKGALQRFQAAHDLMNFPTTGLELGKELAELGKLVEARDVWLKAARLPVEKGEPPPFATARTEADALAEKMAPRIPALRITVNGVPSGASAKVMIDKDEIATSALLVPRKVNPGTRVVTATLGSKEKKQEIDITEGETLDVKFDFADAKTDTSTVKDTGTKKDEPEGPPTDKGEKGKSSLVYVGFVAAGVGVAVGAATGIISLLKTQSAKNDCVDSRCPPSTHSTIDTAMLTGNISTISFAVAGAGLTLGLIGLAISPSAEPTPKPAAARVNVWLGLGSAGLSGAF